MAGAIGLPITLLANLLLYRFLQAGGQSCLIGLVAAIASAILGIVLMVILVPAIRKVAGQDDRKYQQKMPDLRCGAKLGGAIGTCLGIGTTVYLWSLWLALLEQLHIPVEISQLVMGVCVSIGYILVTGCMGAVAVVIGFIIADKAQG